MSLKLKRKSLQVERVAGEGSAETVAEGTVRIPERYPPIGRELQLTARPIVNNVEPTDDRVLVEGTVRLEFLYTALEEEALHEAGDGDQYESSDEERVETLHRVVWDNELAFAYLLEVPGATEDAAVEVTADVTAVNFTVRNDNESVDVDVVLRLSGSLVERETVDVTVGVVGDGIETEYEEVRVRAWLGEASGEGRLSISLPLAGRSLPESILSVSLTPNTVEVNQLEGEVLIRGYLDASSLYLGGEGAGPQFVEWPLGASFEIRVPHTGFSGPVTWEPRVDVNVQEHYVERGDEGAIIHVDGHVTARAAAYRTEFLTCLVNVSSSEDEVASRREERLIYEAVGEGSTRSEVTGVLELTEADPPIERLLCGKADFTLQEVHVLGDKVAVEGQVAVDLLYVGRGEQENPLHSARWPYAVAVDLEIPLPGAEPGLDRSVKVHVRRVEFDVINRETVEVRLQLAAEAKVGRLRHIEIVSEAVRVPPVDEDRPTFTFVITDDDDTLWKLAQVYRTSVEAILAHNEGLAEGEPLERGQKICIVHSQ